MEVIEGGSVSKRPAHGFRADVCLNHLEVEEGFNPRLRVNVMPPEELVDSVRALGVMQPIHVRRKEGCEKLLIVDGHRRLMAAALARNVETVQVVDHGFMSDREALVLAFTLNDRGNQKSFSKREVIETVERLKKLGMSVEEISGALGRKKSTVYNYLSITKATPKLKEAVKAAVEDGGVSTAAVARAALLSKEAQDALAEKLSGKNREQALQAIKEEKAKVPVKTPARAPTVKLTKEEAGGTKQDIRVLTYGETREVKYKVASDYKERCKELDEEVTRRLRRTPSNKEYLGMSKVLACIKGRMKVEDVFRWDKV